MPAQGAEKGVPRCHKLHYGSGGLGLENCDDNSHHPQQKKETMDSLNIIYD